MYMTLHRVNQMLVHPRWTRLTFDHHRTPRILDGVDADVTVEDVTDVVLDVAELWKWAQADTIATRAHSSIVELWRWAQVDLHATRAWQAAIEAHEAACLAGMYQKWLAQETEPRHTRAWRTCAQAARLMEKAWACEVQAAIALHDVAR